MKWHKYTVSFLAYRIWEEISMYNHTTNNWQKEHLMQIDPVYEETQQFMLEWMENWCKEHPKMCIRDSRTAAHSSATQRAMNQAP